MKSCSLHHWILFFIILNLVYPLSVPSLTAKLHQPATLTCNQKCSGLITWKMFGSYVVVRCDQFSCYSKEGFEISHDQYLKGNLDLIIRSVDYSKRTIFTCNCGNTPICDILLIIESVTSQVQKKPGEALVLNMFIPEVEVDYNSKHSLLPFSKSICNVTAGSLQCRTDYKHRASLSHTELTLRELKVSDSGVYIIRDMKNKEVIHTYAVSVEENPSEDLKIPGIDWIFVVGVVVGVILSFAGFGIYFKLKMRRERRNCLDLQMMEEQIMKKARVDELIERYRNRGNGPKPADTTLEELIKIKEEMDELVQKGNTESPEIKELNNWWSKQEPELEKIIEEFRSAWTELEMNRNDGESRAEQR